MSEAHLALWLVGDPTIRLRCREASRAADLSHRADQPEVRRFYQNITFALCAMDDYVCALDLARDAFNS